jgi:hypothetical protein
MCVLKTVSFILSAAGFVLGLLSAYFWLKAGEVSVSPAWELELPRDVIARSPSKSVNDVVHNNIMGWVTGVMRAFKKSGELNRRAAIWTAVTVAVTSFASFLSTIAG